MSERESRTKRLMDDAPIGAYYLWPTTRSRGFAASLARDCGRIDLKVIAPPALDVIKTPADRPLVMDHRCETWLSPERLDQARRMAASYQPPAKTA